MHWIIWGALCVIAGLLISHDNPFIWGPSNMVWMRADVDALIGRHYLELGDIIPEKYGSFAILVLKQGTKNRATVQTDVLYLIVDDKGKVVDWAVAGTRSKLSNGGLERVMIRTVN